MRAPVRHSGYDVFISYGHGSDRGLAPGLQSGLQRLAKPWYRPRALRVFRDETDLAASPDLWGRIEPVLVDSQWLVLIASRKVAVSRYVALEVERWLALGRAERLLIALAEGELVWDTSAGDWDWQRTDALPRALRGAFRGEPLWVDLRKIESGEKFQRENQEFFNCVARIASPIRGLDPAELISQDFRHHARSMRLAWSAAALLAVLLALAIGLGLLAQRERDRAERERQAALVGQARFLAQEADRTRAASPQQSLLVALEAVRVTRDVDGLITPEAEQALRDSLAEAGGIPLDAWRGYTEARLLGGNRVAAYGAASDVKIWNLERLALPPRILSSGSTRIDAVTATSGGEWVAVAGFDPVFLRVYHVGAAAAEDEGIELAGHEGRIHALLFSADDRWLAVGSDAPGVQLWRVGEFDAPAASLLGHEPRRISQDTLNVRHMTGSPSGRWLATQGWDGTARLWDLTQSPPANVLTEDAVSISFEPAFSADDRWVLLGASAFEQGVTLHLRDLLANTAPIDLQAPGATNVVLHPRGEWLAAVTSDDIRVWRTADPSVPLTFPGYHAAFCGDGRWLATAEAASDGEGERVVLRDVAEIEDDRTIAELDSRIERIVFLDGKLGPNLVVVGEEATWLVETDALGERDAQTKLVGHGAPIQDVDVSADGHWLVTRSSFADAPRLWSLASSGCEPIRLRGPEGAPEIEAVTSSGGEGATPYAGLPTLLAFSPEGSEIAVAVDEETVRLYDAGDPFQPPLVLQRPRLEDERRLRTPPAVAYSPDGTWIATARDESSVSLWKRAGSICEETALAPADNADSESRSSASAFAVSSDGRWIAAAGALERIHVWDTRDAGAAPIRLEAPEGWVRSLAFHPARDELAAAVGDGTLRIWDLTHRAKPAAVLSAEKAVQALYLGRGERIVSTGQDPIVRLWRSDDLQAPATELRGHTDGITMAAASRDGRLLATASVDGTIRVWDLQRPSSPPQVLRLPLVGAFGLAVAPDGDRIAAGCMDGIVRLWQVSELSRPPMLLRAIAPDAEDETMVWALQFDRSGSRLAAVASGAVSLWRTRAEELLDVAARTAGRNLSLAEWERVFGSARYRLTAPALGLPANFLDAADAIAEAGDPARAAELYAIAVAASPGLKIDPDARAKDLAVAKAREIGHAYARDGQRNAALASLQLIAELDPDAELDAEAEIRRIEAAAVEVEQGRRLAVQGDLAGALSRFQRAKELDPGLPWEAELEALGAAADAR